ncbi:MAG: small ribosomal subunit Rsm22 family protein [Acidimicrobiales bacterium]
MTPDLSGAIARLLSGEPRLQLAPAARRLSERYRAGTAPSVRTQEDALAYVATRLPATYAAARAAMVQVAELSPSYRPRTQMDLGAGPGAAAWAAAAVWPGLNGVVLRDRDAALVELGQQLAATDFESWSWQLGDMRDAVAEADLVTACYALGELEAAEALEVATAAWRATTGCLLLVEPGTPTGFALIRRLRRHLLEEGARLVAPCPEEGECPVNGQDWCHFSARLGRSALHRALKGAERSFEDEKFSYVAFARGEPTRAAGRVVRRPLLRRRFVELSLCADGMIRPAGIGQSLAAYRAATSLEWGDAAPLEVLALARPSSPPPPQC